ncbi:MAG: transcriptional regulator [Sphingomonadales bacterium CG12_big_fil_rev_8_21_14_0_65_65_10]|nr:MAG: transcriptional regulator [Sphingomonadales bacterium CG12_big_fil_rev_8_21_14_0_65_65_10]
MKLQKETTLHGKWYDDACGTAFGMEVIGERWALLVVRELMFGPRRFSDLRASLPGISAKVLTERLASLEGVGVVERIEVPPPTPARLYGLTDWGQCAEPLIQEVGRWAARSSRHDPTLPLSPVSLMLSFRTMLVRERLAPLEGSVGFDIGGETFVASLTGDLPIARGQIDGCDAIIRVPSATIIAAHVYGDVPLAELERDAGLTVEGNRTLAERLLACFELPPKADA